MSPNAKMMTRKDGTDEFKRFNVTVKHKIDYKR